MPDHNLDAKTWSGRFKQYTCRAIQLVSSGEAIFEVIDYAASPENELPILGRYQANMLVENNEPIAPFPYAWQIEARTGPYAPQNPVLLLLLS
jgi:hypothetical protein